MELGGVRSDVQMEVNGVWADVREEVEGNRLPDIIWHLSCSVVFCYLVFFSSINRMWRKENKQINETGKQIQNFICLASPREKEWDILNYAVVIKMEEVKQTSETLQERRDRIKQENYAE